MDRPGPEEEQKLFVLAYERWTGLLCYTGVARNGNHNTANWLTRTLTHPLGERSPDSVLNALVSDGNTWLRRIPEASRFHTFTLAAFLKGRPRISAVSNFQWVGGEQFSQPLGTFRVSHLETRLSRVALSGVSFAVTDQEKLRLENAVSRLAPKDLRYAVAMTNRRAAERDLRISESCAVAHLHPNGAGEVEVFGNMATSFVPTLIVRGVNMAEYVPKGLADAGETEPHRLVSAGWPPNGFVTAMLGAFRALSAQTGDGWPTDRAEW